MIAFIKNTLAKFNLRTNIVMLFNLKPILAKYFVGLFWGNIYYTEVQFHPSLFLWGIYCNKMCKHEAKLEISILS